MLLLRLLPLLRPLLRLLLRLLLWFSLTSLLPRRRPDCQGGCGKVMGTNPGRTHRFYTGKVRTMLM